MSIFADYEYMGRALELARLAEGRTSPNPMVGAVLVKDGQIVGEGYHQKAGTPHAEVHALRQAGDRARGATLYVNLEPCSHYGRTPPCAEALIQAGVARVVAAMTDPNPLVAGRGMKLLAAAGIKTEVGLRAAEAQRLNEVFIKYITSRRPFVVLKTAMTWDGKIATSTGQSRWVTGSAARTYVHRLRNIYDGIMVGIGTVLADDPQLTVRLEGIPTRNPVRIVVDSRLRVPLQAQVVNQLSNARTIIATTEQAPREKITELEQRGVEVLVVEGRERVDLNQLMLRLGERDICSILLEGGATLNAAALEAGIVDKVLNFIAPKIIGGAMAPTPVGGVGKQVMNDAWCLNNCSVDRIGEDFLLTGYL
ncbi:MAG: bifunctional diaminohydroxyphosphoribosylaminopyrimidine deaminase/5-amino-6-(5-phosphoribosylamino)uracil reductase RibD [Firmicutes bacterium]|nr:bifunctional diaminohydroxyphosphoribosylaminopyrimidine deaminase/5-amino-6-(5-phosphoribosylamino)uracil reductase RibD [Bacillota bacterium]